MLLKYNSSRAKNARILIFIVIFIELISLISSCLQYNILQEILDGYYVTDEQLIANDDRESFIGSVYLLFFIISIYFFICWFRRAYFNLHQLTSNLSFSEGWAAGSWFIPIINLFRPLRIMQELFSKSKSILAQHNLFYENKKEFIGVWWLFWILSNIVGNFAARLSFRADTTEDIMLLSMLNILSSFLLIVCGFFVVRLINDYSKIEDQLQKIQLNKVIKDE